MNPELNTASPVSATLAEDLARLRSDPLDDVGMPGELFLDAAPVADSTDALSVNEPPTATAPTSQPVDGPQRAATEGLGRSGAMSAVESTAAARRRVAESDARVRAWVRLDDGADAVAAALDDERSHGLSRGALHGVPVGVKDLIDIAGQPTGAGSRQWADSGLQRLPVADAGVVTMLRRAGAVILGKTRTHEFAFGGTTPPTCNPHDLRRTPGGSSGGSAAAVAAGHVRLAVGTDTCGSVRIPSSYCGTVGLIPSAGLLPRDGVVPLARSLDRVGLITADVTDLAWAVSALTTTPQPPLEPAQAVRSLEGLRVGIPHDALDEPIDSAVGASFEASVALLRAAGVQTTRVTINHAWAAVTCGVVIFLAEGLDYHMERWVCRPELFGGDVRTTLALAEQVSAADYVRAQRVRRALRDEVLTALSTVDLLLTPTMPSGAPLSDQAASGSLIIGGVAVSVADAHLRYNVLANLAALPAGTQPMGRDANGMPLGLQWTGAPGSDASILAAMTGLEYLQGGGSSSQLGATRPMSQ